jgi:hypothetical protein
LDTGGDVPDQDRRGLNSHTKRTTSRDGLLDAVRWKYPTQSSLQNRLNRALLKLPARPLHHASAFKFSFASLEALLTNRWPLTAGMTSAHDVREPREHAQQLRSMKCRSPFTGC